MLPFSDEDLIVPVKNAIERIRPSLALDGGDLEFISIKNSVVYIQLKGSCIGCASSSTTLKYGVERQLKIDIHPDIVVVNVPLGMENNIENL